jgi:hypothetical protein
MKQIVILMFSILVAISSVQAHPVDESAQNSDRDMGAGSRNPVHQFIPTSYPEPFGLNVAQHWLDPWPHSHFSRRGTPFVHLFILEPAFLDRDLFMDYRRLNASQEDENELEFEVEYALFRRLGLVFEVPIVNINPTEGSSESGLGDIAIAPRALLVDTDRFLLSANLEFSLPTGDENRELGEGELKIGPSVSLWYDLGGWITLNGQLGTEHGIESDNVELSYKGALAWSFLTQGFLPESPHGLLYNHFPPGMANLITEFSGRSIVSGQDDGDETGEVLFGITYTLSTHFEVRSAYQIPVGSPENIDQGWIGSMIYHF